MGYADAIDRILWQNQSCLHVDGEPFLGVQVPLPDEEIAQADAKPEKLAIGGEGGFQVEADKFTIEKSNALVALPDFASVPLPCADLPELVLQSISGVLVGCFQCMVLDV